jgi:hypothetical protein
MVNAAVLNFYRVMFPNRADPNLDGPWGPVLIDGLLEGSRAGRDLFNLVLRLEAAQLGNGLCAPMLDQVLLLVRQTAMDDCGNVPGTFLLRPKKHLRVPKPWPSPIALAQRREQSRDDFEAVYRQGYVLGYAAALQSLAGAVGSSVLADRAAMVADLVMTDFV